MRQASLTSDSSRRFSTGKRPKRQPPVAVLDDIVLVLAAAVTKAGFIED